VDDHSQSPEPEQHGATPSTAPMGDVWGGYFNPGNQGAMEGTYIWWREYFEYKSLRVIAVFIVAARQVKLGNLEGKNAIGGWLPKQEKSRSQCRPSDPGWNEARGEFFRKEDWIKLDFP